MMMIKENSHRKLGRGTHIGSSQAMAVNPPSRSKYNWATFSSTTLRISLPFHHQTTHNNNYCLHSNQYNVTQPLSYNQKDNPFQLDQNNYPNGKFTDYTSVQVRLTIRPNPNKMATEPNQKWLNYM